MAMQQQEQDVYVSRTNGSVVMARKQDGGSRMDVLAIIRRYLDYRSGFCTLLSTYITALANKHVYTARSIAKEANR